MSDPWLGQNPKKTEEKNWWLSKLFIVHVQIRIEWNCKNGTWFSEFLLWEAFTSVKIGFEEIATRGVFHICSWWQRGASPENWPRISSSLFDCAAPCTDNALPPIYCSPDLCSGRASQFHVRGQSWSLVSTQVKLGVGWTMYLPFLGGSVVYSYFWDWRWQNPQVKPGYITAYSMLNSDITSSTSP